MVSACYRGADCIVVNPARQSERYRMKPRTENFLTRAVIMMVVRLYQQLGEGNTWVFSSGTKQGGIYRRLRVLWFCRSGHRGLAAGGGTARAAADIGGPHFDGAGKLDAPRVRPAPICAAWSAAISPLACGASPAADGTHLHADHPERDADRDHGVPAGTIAGRSLACRRHDAGCHDRLPGLWHYPPRHAPLAHKQRLAEAAQALACAAPPPARSAGLLWREQRAVGPCVWQRGPANRAAAQLMVPTGGRRMRIQKMEHQHQ